MFSDMKSSFLLQWLLTAIYVNVTFSDNLHWLNISNRGAHLLFLHV